jgi:hypothetical protein
MPATSVADRKLIQVYLLRKDGAVSAPFLFLSGNISHAEINDRARFVARPWPAGDPAP